MPLPEYDLHTEACAALPDERCDTCGHTARWHHNRWDHTRKLWYCRGSVLCKCETVTGSQAIEEKMAELTAERVAKVLVGDDSRVTSPLRYYGTIRNITI